MRVITHGFFLGNLSSLSETLLLLALDDSTNALRVMYWKCEDRCAKTTYLIDFMAAVLLCHIVGQWYFVKMTSTHLEVASNMKKEGYVGNGSDGQEK